MSQKKPGRLTLQLDELWSFVGCKENKQWLWLAMDVDTREIVGVYLGDRTGQAAKRLWQSLPPNLPSVRALLHRLLGSLGVTE